MFMCLNTIITFKAIPPAAATLSESADDNDLFKLETGHADQRLYR
jgi:hypothetical protein